MFGIQEMITNRVTITFIVLHTIFHVAGYHEKKDNQIYILIWMTGNYEPFNFIKMGNIDFKNCDFDNCFLTGNRNYFRNVVDYDVIMFNNIHLPNSTDQPSNRSSKQRYCMLGLETAVYHEVPEKFNGFFNITFTYRLTSNVTIPYVVIKDENDKIIGPKVDMHWKKLSEMNETSDYVKSKLQNKHIAAAWIVSHCETPFRRLYAKALQIELAEYGHSLDIYGRCGNKQCPKGEYGKCGNFGCPQFERMDDCLAIIESDYYFYLSFENSFCDDYVTEKLLNALGHFTVPVVYGGANYTRFMPDGIYLDATVLEPNKMAERINDIVKDKNKYYEFFRWHDYYSYHFSGEDRYSAELCRLCAFLNDSVNKTSTYENISNWWNVYSPAWPTDIPSSTTPPTLTTEERMPQNKIENVITSLLGFLDPSD